MKWLMYLSKAIDLLSRFGVIYANMEAVDAHTAPAAAYQPAADVILNSGDVQDMAAKLDPEQQELLRRGLPVALRALDLYLERGK